MLRCWVRDGLVVATGVTVDSTINEFATDDVVEMKYQFSVPPKLCGLRAFSLPKAQASIRYSDMTDIALRKK